MGNSFSNKNKQKPAPRVSEESKRKHEADLKETQEKVSTLHIVNLALKSNTFHADQITHILNDLYRESVQNYAQKAAPVLPTCQCCSVCYSDFGEENWVIQSSYCGHNDICGPCFQNYLSIRIRDADVMPYIQCPHPDCRVPLAVSDLLSSRAELFVFYQLARTSLLKLLARAEWFVGCESKGCGGGFCLEGEREERKVCEVCGVEQLVKPKGRELDDEFKKMIANGTLRPCPKCQYLTMKEYGICNVIECVACGIWWNWRTKETGKNSNDLKNRARGSGSLWEPGELAYQQRLQREKPHEFRALLERNGIRYDPNYVRGS
eukprot:TRINITY_DN3608_c0_g2_i5.p1 TRINITY_DN3608_c0_g2~~TRINITY_DN3608_c0_g2_i5.p1  ORF type:complete len:321 (+),score=11.89 TRINITY_DN3608_c0_g2_i5:42-1004(+)